MTLYHRFAEEIGRILDSLEAEGAIPAGLSRRAVSIEPPRDPAHGDLATNAAMVLAKPAGTNPRALAALLAPKLEQVDGVTCVEIAGPGFLNLRLAAEVWHEELATILGEGGDYGRSSVGEGHRVNVEYVSANPTGPMHMGHCRGAVVGDALASLLAFVGHPVTREYYVNDAGSQVQTLGRSAHLRYREALGEDIGDIPQGFYPGEYLKPVGMAFAAEFGTKYADAPEEEWLDLFRTKAVAAMMDMIRADLALLGIHHDVFASEAEVQNAGKVDAAFAELHAKGLLYEGVLEAPKGETPDDWEPVELTLFKATEFGDDQDRPVRNSKGGLTYFGTDLAYHAQKAQEADELIDIWGADHAGTVKRIQAAVAALTGGTKRFDVKLVQMVKLLRNGEPVKMSKRAGTFVTLADVVREVGRDVVRFTMLTRKADAQMDFDFVKVVEASKDNPVFYVQYAHARCRSVLRHAATALPHVDQAPAALAARANLARLDAEEEMALAKRMAAWPRLVESAADAHEPHRIAFYLYDLASDFHALWNRGRDDTALRFLIESDEEVTVARLALVAAVATVIASGLAVMGVEPAEELRS